MNSVAFLHNITMTFNHISLVLSTRLGSSSDEMKSSIGSRSFGGSFSSILDTFYNENNSPFVRLHSGCAAVLLFELFHCFCMSFSSHLQGEKCVITYRVTIHGCWWCMPIVKKNQYLLYHKIYICWHQDCEGIWNCIPDFQLAICSFSIHRDSSGMLVMVGEGGIAV